MWIGCVVRFHYFVLSFSFSGKEVSVIEIFVETEMCGDIDWSASE